MRSLSSLAKILVTFLLLGLTRWNGISCYRVPNQRAECAYPEPCYDWIKIQECNMGSTPQTSPAVIISECTTKNPRNPWARAYRYFAYQFDLIQEGGDGAVEHGGVVAVSRCTKKTNGTVDRPNAVAVIRAPVFTPGSCRPIRVTFWYRLSHQPTFSAEPEQEYNLKVLVEDIGQFPNETIWGKETDYADFVPGQWHYAEALFGRSIRQQFRVNFFAYHNDDCQTNLRTVAIDNIVIEQAVRSDVCTTTTTTPYTTTTTSTVSTTTTDTTTTESTTPSSTTSDGTDIISGCEIGPAIVATCLKGVVKMLLTNFETSDAVETVFNGDNTYACRTHLRSLHVWLLAEIPEPSRTNYPFSPTTVTCRKGQLDFSHYDPDSTEATKLVFRAPSVDLRCRTVFVEFLQHLASIGQ